MSSSYEIIVHHYCQMCKSNKEFHIFVSKSIFYHHIPILASRIVGYVRVQWWPVGIVNQSWQGAVRFLKFLKGVLNFTVVVTD